MTSTDFFFEVRADVSSWHMVGPQELEWTAQNHDLKRPLGWTGEPTGLQASSPNISILPV